MSTIAAMIIEELEDETRWGATSARSQDILAELVAKAMADRGRSDLSQLKSDRLILDAENCDR